MKMAVWVTILNLGFLIAGVVVLVYLLVLIIRALRKYLAAERKGTAGKNLGPDTERTSHPVQDDPGVCG